VRAGGDRENVCSQEEQAVELTNKRRFGIVLPFAKENVSEEPKNGEVITSEIEGEEGLHPPEVSKSDVIQSLVAMNEAKMACGVPDDGMDSQCTHPHPMKGACFGVTPWDDRSATVPSQIRGDVKQGGETPHPDVLWFNNEGGPAAHWTTTGGSMNKEWDSASEICEQREVHVTCVDDDEVQEYEEATVESTTKPPSIVEEENTEDIGDGEIFELRKLPVRAIQEAEVRYGMTATVKLNDVDIPALHDTGAEVSVIQSSWAKKAQLKITQVDSLKRVLNPNGEPFKCEGTAMVKILVGSQFREISLMVVDDIDIPLVLGQDFLEKHQVTINCGQGVIWYGQEQVHTLPIRKRLKKLYKATDGVRLLLHEPLTLESGQRATVGCVVSENTTKWDVGWAWMVEPLEKPERELGLGIPTALVEFKGQNKMFVLGVSNFSESPVTLAKGFMIGRLRTLSQHTTLSPIRPEEEKCGSHEVEVSSEEDKVKKAERVLKFSEMIDAKLQENKALDEKQKEEYKTLLLKHVDVLSAEKLGTVKSVSFDIDVEGANPVRHRDRRWSQPELAVMKKEIDMLSKMGLIESADGEWASRLVMVTKKDGSTRVCVDFRAVNKLCKMDAYPSPSVEGTLDQLNGACWFTAFDAEKGYYQIAMTRRAKDVSAFRCPFGYFRFTKMPFGMKNAGATFQRMMDMVLKGLTWKCCMVFVDDVVVYSRSWEDHLRDVDLVLTKFKECGITLNLKKCMFALNQLPFLGHIVSPDGIKPDPAKVKAVKKFIQPSGVAGLRSFLGMSGQLRKFVKGYALIARPLNAMLANARAPAWKAGVV